MKIFTFDLQRFADTETINAGSSKTYSPSSAETVSFTVNGKTYSMKLYNGSKVTVSVDSSNNITITLSQGMITDLNNSFANTTFEVQDKFKFLVTAITANSNFDVQYTHWVSFDAAVTKFKIISATSEFTVKSGQTVTLGDTNIVPSFSNGTIGVTTVTSDTSTTFNLKLTNTASTEGTFTVGNATFTIGSASVASTDSISLSTDGTNNTVTLGAPTSTDSSFKKQFTFDNTTYATKSGSVNFTYGSGTSVSGLTANESFTATANNSTIVYETDSENYLIAYDSTDSSKIRLYTEGAVTDKTIPMTDLAFSDNNSKLIDILPIENDTLAISGDVLTLLGDNGSLPVYKKDKYSTKYGKISLNGTTDAGTVKLEKDSGTGTLSSIAISVTNAVTLASDFSGVSIDISNTKFSATASGDFTVSSADSAVSVANASAINLNSGTIKLVAGQSLTTADSGNNNYTISDYGGGSDGLTVANSSGTITIGDIDSSETFKIDDYTYTMLSNGRLQRTDNSNVTTMWNGTAFTFNETTGASVTLTDLNTASNWNSVIEIENNALTIATDTVNQSSTSYMVLKGDPTKIYGTLARDNNGYTLSTDEKTANTELTSVTISNELTVNFPAAFLNKAITAGEVATFSVTTSASNYAVNYASGAVSVDKATAITLTSGTLTLSNSSQTITANNVAVSNVTGSVTVAYDSTSGVTVADIGYNENVTIDNVVYAVTAGNGITVNVNNGTTTISGLASGDTFTVGGTEYKVTDVALYKKIGDDYLIYNGGVNILTDGAITTTQLDSGSWGDTLQITDGALSIASSTLTSGSATIVSSDLSKIYGTLSTDGTTYTLTKTATAQKPTGFSFAGLSSVTIASGVTINVASDFSGLSYTVNGATISDIALSDSATTFTVNATSTPVLSADVTSFTLSTGSVALQTNQTVTASGHTIIPTTGTVNVTVSGTTVSVSELDTGDKLTIDNVTYEMTAAGLLNTTDGQQLIVLSDKTYTIGSTPTRIIATTDINATTLDLTNETTSADVYESLTAPVTKLATLTVSGGKFTLNKTNANKIATINIAKNTDFVVDFAATINATDIATVNSRVYNGSGALVINSTANSSTLYSGIIILDSVNSSATATNDSTALTVGGSTSITATAAEGKFTTISGLDANETFSLGGKTYTQYTAGLTTGSTIATSLTPSTLNISNLSTAQWLEFLAATEGVLNLSNVSKTALVYDDISNPTNLLANLTVTDGAFVLDSVNSKTAADVFKTIQVANGANLTVDFKTQVSASGSVTVNSQLYNATGSLVIDADGSSSTLYSGSVTLDSSNSSLTATNENYDLYVDSGTIRANVTAGKFTSLNSLDNGDSFTYQGVTYTKSKLGLVQGNTICTDLNSSTLELSKLDDATWSSFIAPTNGELNLSKLNSNYVVFDHVTNPSKILATFTISGSNLTLKSNANYGKAITLVDIPKNSTLTVDFASQVNAAGSVTVNGQSYSSTGSILLNTTADSSTLTTGTVILKGDVVTTTAGNVIIATGGDGISVTANANSASIGNMTSGDSFLLDATAYTISAVAPLKNNLLWSGAADYKNGLTATELATESNWSATTAAKNGNLFIDATTLADDQIVILVDSTISPTKIYGTLSKLGGSYTLTNGSTKLSSITVDGAIVDVDSSLADVPITTINSDDSQTLFTVTAPADFFTVDATGIAPKKPCSGGQG